MILRLTCVGIVLFYSALASQAWAGDHKGWNMKQWASHHLLAVKSWAQNLTSDENLQAHRYLNYENREQCQNYRALPDGLEKLKCEKALKKGNFAKPVLGQVFRTYTLLLDYDSASLTSESQTIVKKIAKEINSFDPRQVTVSGYTDRSGPSTYNVALSQRRATAASSALTNLGVKNQVIRKAGFGEQRLAVKTNDGVRERKNRRVVVEFRR